MLLRSLTLEDAPDVQHLAGDRDVASTVLRIPHPYEDGMAEEWIRSCSEDYQNEEAINFAIIRNTEQNLIG
ncbi:MAG: GNAT family N-acetyltransferase, partial [Candidatus Poribacteria bacterium]|nr:GNAT family N-acetyltransferase [Candidatus Poribacteria bacterium]